MSQITTEQLQAAIRYFKNENGMAVKDCFDKMPLVMEIFKICAEDMLSLATDPNIKVITATPPEETLQAAREMIEDFQDMNGTPYPPMSIFGRNYNLAFQTAPRDDRLPMLTPKRS